MSKIINATLLSAIISFPVFNGCSNDQAKVAKTAGGRLGYVEWFKIGSGFDGDEVTGEDTRLFRPRDVVAFSLAVSGFENENINVSVYDKKDGALVVTVLDFKKESADVSIYNRKWRIITVARKGTVIARATVGKTLAVKEIQFELQPDDLKP